LMVRPSAPRFLNFGDKCELPVVIQNQTDHEMSVDLGLRADNLKFTHQEGETAGDNSSHKDSGASVLVPANDRVEVRFPAATD
ncbi:alpha-2-macroglobulin family protein, partial [Staphylococcus aureus]